MGKNNQTAIQPTRVQNYPEWYQQVIKAADLAEQSPVRGCMVIKPWGYSLWENIQSVLDSAFKRTGHKNAYFPIFIPKRFLEQEAAHVEGFAKECAVVTHHRLEMGENGELVPAGKLEEPLIVRPTSETIIGEMFAKWVQSYRDLPLLINQWANVVRWEMRPRLFLRTAEFLWQEGHTVHATSEEAMQEVKAMLDVYADFAENYMAMPVIKGEKSEGERFPGAVDTLCIEAMMQDGKALQAGTSHFLGQNFAKASNIKYLNEEGDEVYAWTTSWGVSTRLIGGMIMTHGDDDGMIIPPRLAPSHVVILPIIHKNKGREEILPYAEKIKAELEGLTYNNAPLRVELDDRDLRGGEKNWQWVKKGIPVRIEIGMKEVENNLVFMGRRDLPAKEKTSMAAEEFVKAVPQILEEIQNNLFQRALDFRESNTIHATSKEEFYDYFRQKKAKDSMCACGFVKAYWAGDAELEKKIKEDLNVTVRCIPIEQNCEPGTCIFTGKENVKIAIFAKAY